MLLLNPDTGSLPSSAVQFRFSLTGAFLMDYIRQGEITLNQKRIVPAFRTNTDPVHELFASRIGTASSPKKISLWISRLSNKSRFILNNLVLKLEKESIIRVEHRKFLGIFPYRRYFLNNPGKRLSIIENLRSILLHGRQPASDDLMLLALLETSGAYRKLSEEGRERRAMRKKNRELIKGNVAGTEISQAIREVQAAVAAAVTVAVVASHGSH